MGKVERCTVHFMSLVDAEKSASNPALASLVSNGWTPISHFVGERAGQPELVMIMAPPKPHQKLPLVAYLGLTIGVALGACIGGVMSALITVNWLSL